MKLGPLVLGPGDAVAFVAATALNSYMFGFGVETVIFTALGIIAGALLFNRKPTKG